MQWLAPIDDFRAQLAAARAEADVKSRMEALSRLAQARLSYVQTMQLDAALMATPACGDFDSVRIYLLSTHTIDHVIPALRVAGLRQGMRFECHAGGYGQARQDVYAETSPLYAANPDFVLLSLSAHSMIGSVPLTATCEEADAAAKDAVIEISAMWRRIRERTSAQIIQQSALDLSHPIFGGLDSILPGGRARLTQKLNFALGDAATRARTLWLDIAQACAREGRDAWFDETRWLQGKMEIAPQATIAFGELTARLIAAARGKSKKCMVLDLDDTLWAGAVGDDGVDGIVLGEGSPLGEAHLALQRYAKSLRDRGVLLAVCSKNDSDIAKAAVRDHPEMILRLEDFASFHANWSDKAENLRAIANELNIGLDALVFVDNSPVERARVRQALPMVATPELPDDPSQFVRCVAAGGYFEAVGFSQEDRDRAALYQAEHRRSAMRQSVGDLEGFLRDLEMRVEWSPISPLNMQRATQLINKTNQFNTTSIRRNEGEVASLCEPPDGFGLCFRLVDKFGDNGVVSVAILRSAADAPGTCDLVNWVMSCRVFGRQLEDEALNIIVEQARAKDIRSIRAPFSPTKKNGVIGDLFVRLGFDCIEGRPGEESRWALDLGGYEARRTWIARSESDV